MKTQPFDDYKNKNVEYDYVIQANVKVKELSNDNIYQIMNWLQDEDFMAPYFPKLGLGRIYGKVTVENGLLNFKLGISLVDAVERPSNKDLEENAKNFILGLNKNIENNKFDIQESDIKVEVLTESKLNVNDVDKKLITEGELNLTRNGDTQSFKLTDDGIVERYSNGNLNSMFPFAKLTLTREYKQLIQDGYVLTEDMNDNEEYKKSILQDPEQAKQNIQDEIDLVDELQAKQDELNTKLDNLLGESKEDYPEFPSNEFSEEPVIYDDLNVETFNEFLTSGQKAYINAYIGTIEEFVQAMQLLYDEVGDGVAPMISINDYVKEILSYDGGIPEWTQELSDMLGFDLKTEGKSKFYTAENAFDDFIKNVKEDDDKDEDGYYDFQMQDLGITKEATAEFKNLLLQRDEIEDIKYEPQNNLYKVKLANKSDKKKEESIEYVSADDKENNARFKEWCDKILSEPRSEDYKKGMELKDKAVEAWKNNDIPEAYKIWLSITELIYKEESDDPVEELRKTIEWSLISHEVESQFIYDMADYAKRIYED